MFFPTAVIVLLTSTAFAWPPGGGGGPPKPPCSANVIALATGIHLNIEGQYAEYNGTQALINLESKPGFSQSQFQLLKGELLSDIQAGENIRLFNQQIAPPNNPAIPGLAKYEAAQQVEQALAQGLTGNPQHDLKSLNSLKSDITAGIALNEQNLKNATQNCDFTLVFPPADESGS